MSQDEEKNIANEIQEIIDDWSNYGFLSHSYGSDGRSAVGYWTEELKYLAHLALQAPEEADWLQTGVFQGGGTCLLGTVIRNTGNNRKIHDVDITFTGYNGAYNHNVFNKGKFQDIINCIETNTLYLAEKLAQIDNLKLGLVAIDSWHSFRAVITEFEAVKPYLVPGAIVMLHDMPSRHLWVLEDAAYRANANYDVWMKSDMPDIDGSDLQAYHQAEQQQDFLMLEALAYIIDHNPDFELLPLPAQFECNHENLTGGPYKHGSTSPNNALAAIRKKV